MIVCGGESVCVMVMLRRAEVDNRTHLKCGINVFQILGVLSYMDFVRVYFTSSYYASHSLYICVTSAHTMTRRD